jgi:dTDP-4-dehydrorhamnose reductase
MRVIVTGANGQVGSALVKLLRAEGTQEVKTITRENCDIADRVLVRRLLGSFQPDLVLHPAAYTYVDQCESDPETAYRINALGTQNLALAAAQVGAAMVYVSTNAVFNGRKATPYYEYDMPDPESVYGRSKLAGEEYVKTLLNRFYIVRTSWVFGPRPTEGKLNFVRRMLQLGDERGAVSVVDDEISNPTYAPDLAAAILQLVQTEAYGLYHLSNEGPTSRYEFAREIFRLGGRNQVKVTPSKLADFPRPTPPLYQSALHNFAAATNLDIRLRPWQEALEEYLRSDR